MISPYGNQEFKHFFDIHFNIYERFLLFNHEDTRNGVRGGWHKDCAKLLLGALTTFGAQGVSHWMGDATCNDTCSICRFRGKIDNGSGSEGIFFFVESEVGHFPHSFVDDIDEGDAQHEEVKLIDQKAKEEFVGEKPKDPKGSNDHDENEYLNEKEEEIWVGEEEVSRLGAVGGEGIHELGSDGAGDESEDGMDDKKGDEDGEEDDNACQNRFFHGYS